MSLTIIAMTGILIGFLCLAVGFFMEESDTHTVGSETPLKSKRARRTRKRDADSKRKAA